MVDLNIRKDNKTPILPQMEAGTKKTAFFKGGSAYMNIANYPFNTGELDKYFLEG